MSRTRTLVEFALENATDNPSFPQVYYDADGDCLEFIIAGDNYKGERLDELVTVYRSLETNEIVGSLIKGLRAKLRRMVESNIPGFVVEIQDGPVKLSHLFRALIWSSQPRDIKKLVTYRHLISVAEEADVEAEGFCIA